MHNPGKTHDRKKCVTGNHNICRRILTGHYRPSKSSLKTRFTFGNVTNRQKNISENRDRAGQKLSKKTITDVTIHSSLNSDANRTSQNGSQVSNHHAKSSVSSDEQATTIEHAVTTMPLQSISSKSEFNCNPTSEIQGTEKHSHPASPLEEVSKSSRNSDIR